MKITICGHRRLAKILAERPNQCDVIMISSPTDFFAVEGSERIPELARNCLKLAFHDISIVRNGMTEVQREHVEEALKFAEGKDELFVACQAGISRSSSIAYVIKAKEVGSFEALAILDPMVHHPNGLVVKLGAQILKDPDMQELVHIWNNKAIALQCEDPVFDGIK